MERATFGSMRSVGAASPVAGIARAESQHSTANAMIIVLKASAPPPIAVARPATMVPSRMARKVAASTSALPAVSSSRRRWSGRMPYLIGPNRAAMVPNRPSATNSTGTECIQKPIAAAAAPKISANFSRLAMRALS